MAGGLEYAGFIRGLNDHEMKAFRTLQQRLVDKDKDVRRKARNEYSRWLDYLMVVGRVTPELRHKLEHYRMEERHV